jgi:hypothetical protein
MDRALVVDAFQFDSVRSRCVQVFPEEFGRPAEDLPGIDIKLVEKLLPDFG